MTGLGEGIIRLALAKQIALAMKHRKSPVLAARESLNELVTRIQGQAGALVLAPNGRFAIRHGHAVHECRSLEWQRETYGRG